MKLFQRYTEDERRYLRDNYMGKTSAQLAAAIGRTESSVCWQLMQMNLKRGGKKVWTQEELDQLKIDAPHFSRKELAARFGVTVNQVVAAVKNHKIKSGRTAHFVKGMVPINKGKKMHPGWGGEGIKTRFKKGQLPHNTLQDGTIITRKYRDGSKYKWIRVSHKFWRPLSHVTFEKIYGPVPEGYLVAFKDGNPLNCEASNLFLESKQEHMKRNTIARFPPEVISAIHVLNKFKRKIRSYAEKQN